MCPGARPLTEGEQWTRDELARLLAARFTPPALARFLLASQRRAGEVRRARPGAAARLRRWSAAGALAWAVLAAAGAAPFRRRLREGLAWWAATAVMLDWHLGMFESEDGEPRDPGPADALTLLRAWLVPLVHDAPTPAVVLLAAATDHLDGRVARASVPTRAGRDLEGLVDACFTLAALRGAVRTGQLAPAVAGLEAVRLAAGTAYATGVYFAGGRAPDPAVLRAARLSTPVRAGGLLAGAAGRRRTGGGLLAAGSAWSLLALARARRGR